MQAIFPTNAAIMVQTDQDQNLTVLLTFTGICKSKIMG